MVGETDHSSYAILYYQKGRSISVKLYGGSVFWGLWHMKDVGGRKVGNLGWDQELPAGALEHPGTGMGVPKGPGPRWGIVSR